MRNLLIGMTVAALCSGATTAQSMTGSAYATKAGASDLYERQASMLEMKSTNPQLREFATMMVKDHAQSTADIKAAAMKGGVKLAPAKLTPMQARDIAALKATTGEKRDMLYIEQQKAAHADALMVHQGYAADGKVASLKMTAGKIVPVVEHHKMMIDAM